MKSALEVARDNWLNKRLVCVPGVYDALGALLARQAGFEAVYLGGNALGLHLGIGQPFVCRTDTVASLESIRRVCSLPVIVDAATGFGDPAHAFVTMRSLEAAGAAAVHIDDQIYPKRAHYHRGRARLDPTDKVAEKLAAMRDARRGAGPLLIARTDALRAGHSLNDTIARCQSYLDAGAEALIVLDLGPDQVAACRERLGSVPLFWIGGIDEPVPGTSRLEDAGFDAAIYPFAVVSAVFEAVGETLAGLRETGRPPAGKRPARFLAREALEAIGFDAMTSIETSTTEREETV